MDLIKSIVASPTNEPTQSLKRKASQKTKDQPLLIPRSSPYSTDDKKHFSKYEKVLPGYELKELIDKGSMGKVYKAIHTETGKQVAIKYVKNAFDHTVLAMQIVREIQILRSLSEMK